MAEKRINTRIVNRHDTEAVWKSNPTIIPEKGEMIVYDIDDNHNFQRIKMGDGKTPVNDLPFIGADLHVSTTKPEFACTWFKPKN